MDDHNKPDESEERPTFWQPPEKRDRISDEGRKWLEENAEAIKAWNAWVEEHGLPLEEYRMF
jgi:hypothetical protein